MSQIEPKSQADPFLQRTLSKVLSNIDSILDAVDGMHRDVFRKDEAAQRLVFDKLLKIGSDCDAILTHAPEFAKEHPDIALSVARGFANYFLEKPKAYDASMILLFVVCNLPKMQASIRNFLRTGSSSLSSQQIRRIELAELMLGLEIDIRFISIAQAVAIHASVIQDLGGEPGLRDVVALENALHAPMILCAHSGERDIEVLACELERSILDGRPFLARNEETAVRLARELRLRNQG